MAGSGGKYPATLVVAPQPNYHLLLSMETWTLELVTQGLCFLHNRREFKSL